MRLTRPDPWHRLAVLLAIIATAYLLGRIVPALIGG